MPSPNKQLDWVFSEELDEEESSWPWPTDVYNNHIAGTKPGRQVQPHVMLELLVGIAVVYGIAMYLMWQHSVAQLSVFEQELIVLRQEVFRQRYVETRRSNHQDTIKLAQQLVAIAAGGKQKTEWQPILMGLQLYLKREIDRPGWQREEVYLARRRFAQTQSLALVQQASAVDNGQSDAFLQRMPIADELADPLIEFILNTFGYHYLPSLLQAFEEDETWETLVPVVFEMSIQEFEEEWHTYLQERYPTTKQKSTKP